MRRFYLYLFFVLLGSSCSWFDKPEMIPAYIYIPEIQLQTTSAQGTASHGIVDAWVYVDDNPIGVFALPARVPILEEGPHKVAIYGGIKDDGISGKRSPYAFYQPYVLNDFNLTLGQVDTLNGTLTPVVTYYDASFITIWKEADFADPFVLFEADPTSDTIMNRTTDPAEVFEGAGSGKVVLTSSQFLFYGVTQQAFSLPYGGKPIYVELNYKCNTSFRMGIRAVQTANVVNEDNTVINPSYDDSGNLVWKKMYCNYTELVNLIGFSNSHEIYVKVINDGSVSNPYLLIDNVKLIYAN